MSRNHEEIDSHLLGHYCSLSIGTEVSSGLCQRRNTTAFAGLRSSLSSNTSDIDSGHPILSHTVAMTHANTYRTQHRYDMRPRGQKVTILFSTDSRIEKPRPRLTRVTVCWCNAPAPAPALSRPIALVGAGEWPGGEEPRSHNSIPRAILCSSIPPSGKQNKSNHEISRRRPTLHLDPRPRRARQPRRPVQALRRPQETARPSAVRGRAGVRLRVVRGAGPRPT